MYIDSENSDNIWRWSIRNNEPWDKSNSFIRIQMAMSPNNRINTNNSTSECINNVVNGGSEIVGQN